MEKVSHNTSLYPVLLKVMAPKQSIRHDIVHCVRADLHGTTLSHVTSLRHDLGPFTCARHFQLRHAKIVCHSTPGTGDSNKQHG